MKSVVRIERQAKVKDVRALVAGSGLPIEEIDTRVALIQALIPLGQQAVGEALDAEVAGLAGARYCRRGERPGVVRWGQQLGSVYLADQKLPVPVPRVRDRGANLEIPLTTYERLQIPRAADVGLFRKVLVGLTCQQYAVCAEVVLVASALSASNVSRCFVRASVRHLLTLCERRLDQDEFVAVVLNGKTFAQDAMVIALGLTLQGQKKVLGFVQTATESESVCAVFLRVLVERGLRVAPGLLCIIDGAKGLRTAIRTVFRAQALVQRGQWHSVRTSCGICQTRSRRPGVGDSNRSMRDRRMPRLERAWAGSDRNCGGINVSAVASLDEGLEETLTLHGLGLFPLLGVSLKTINCLEFLNAQFGQLINKVDHWRTSDQKQRWIASALRLIKPRLRRIRATAISCSCARRCRPRSGRSRVWKKLVLRDDRIEAASEFQLRMGLIL